MKNMENPAEHRGEGLRVARYSMDSPIMNNRLRLPLVDRDNASVPFRWSHGYFCPSRSNYRAAAQRNYGKRCGLWGGFCPLHINTLYGGL